MKPSKLLVIILLILLGWHAYDILGTHTSGEVIAYKSFARAVLNGDRQDVTRFTATGERQPATALDFIQEREQRHFLNTDKVFTHYRIIERRRSDDGERAYLRAEQITRINRVGGPRRLWGADRVSIDHRVELVRERSAWRVVRFYDPVMSVN